jgi:hypothetical protein
LIAEENKKLIKHLEHQKELIFNLQKNIHTITEERDQLELERDVIEQNFKTIHLNEYNELIQERDELKEELHKTKEERDKDLVYMNKLLEAVSKGEMKLVEHKKKEDFFLSVVGDKEIN